MTSRPHDVGDLYLAPLALQIDALIEELASLSGEELGFRIVLAINWEPKDAVERNKALLEMLTMSIDLHGWTADWHARGLRLAHDDRSLVLGLPESLTTYLAE